MVLYIIRRTFGFKKTEDQISLKQLQFGITKRQDGEQLDRGTGMAKSSILVALKSLEKRGLIKVRKTMTKDGDNSINAYSLRFQERVVRKVVPR